METAPTAQDFIYMNNTGWPWEKICTLVVGISDPDDAETALLSTGQLSEVSAVIFHLMARVHLARQTKTHLNMARVLPDGEYTRIYRAIYNPQTGDEQMVCTWGTR